MSAMKAARRPSQTVSWADAPAAVVALPRPPLSYGWNDEDRLPDGWDAATDPSSGRRYYYQSATGVTSWERPRGELPGRRRRRTEGEASVTEDDAYARLLLSLGELASSSPEGMSREGSLPVHESPWSDNPAKGDGNSMHSASVPSVSFSSTSSSPCEWEETVDPSSGRTYYYNADTGESAWEKPVGYGVGGGSGPRGDGLPLRRESSLTCSSVGSAMAASAGGTGLGGLGGEGARGAQGDDGNKIERAFAAISANLDALRDGVSAGSIPQLEDDSRVPLQGEAMDAQNDAPMKMEEDKDVTALTDAVSNLSAGADAQIRLRQEALAEKEFVESMLQKELEGMTAGMDRMRADANDDLDRQRAALERLEASVRSESREKAALAAQIAQLRRDMADAQGEARKAIEAKNEEVVQMREVLRAMRDNIEQERKARDEAVQSKAGVEGALHEKIEQLSREREATRKTAERAVREKTAELEVLSALVKRSNESMGKEARESRKLQAELARASKAMEDIDLERQRRDEALRNKDTTLSELEKQNAQIAKDIEEAKVQSRKEALAKADEIRALEERVSHLTATTERDMKLRRKAQLKHELSDAKRVAQKAIDARKKKHEKLEHARSSMRASLAQERRAREGSSRGASGLEKALQKGIDKLSREMEDANTLAKEVVADKKREMAQLKAQLKQLEGEMAEGEAKAPPTPPGPTDALASAERDLEKLMQLRDHAKREREALHRAAQSRPPRGSASVGGHAGRRPPPSDRSTKSTGRLKSALQSMSSKGSVCSERSGTSRGSKSFGRFGRLRGPGNATGRLRNLVLEIPQPKRAAGRKEKAGEARSEPIHPAPPGVGSKSHRSWPAPPPRPSGSQNGGKIDELKMAADSGSLLSSKSSYVPARMQLNRR